MKATKYQVEYRQSPGYSWGYAGAPVVDRAVAEQAYVNLVEEGYEPDCVRIMEVTITETRKDITPEGPDLIQVIGNHAGSAVRLKTAMGELTVRNEKDDLVDRTVIRLPNRGEHPDEIIIERNSYYFRRNRVLLRDPIAR